MKKFIAILSIFLANFSLLFSQSTSPPGIPYQAIARNANGTPYVNANLTVRFSLHEQTATGTVSYAETKSLQTNDLGLFSTIFGSGTPIAGTFAGINWAQTTKFLQVEINLGSAWVDMGTQQLMSVPYAMYAGSSATSNSTNYSPTADSTLNLISAKILSPGTYTVPSNEHWKIVSMNTVSGFGTRSQTLNWSGSCTCLPPGMFCNTFYCYYNVNALPIIQIKNDTYYGSVTTGSSMVLQAADCSVCPPTSNFNIGFSFDTNTIKFPIWLQPNENLVIYDNLRVSIERYR
jgi:hypothetical protein